MDIKIPQTLAEWNAAGAAYLPGHLGLTFLKAEPQEVVAQVTARKELGAWNGALGEYVVDFNDVAAADDPHAAALEFAHAALRHGCESCDWDPALLASAEGTPPPVA